MPIGSGPGSRPIPETPLYRSTISPYVSMARTMRREARQGLALPWVITYGGRFAGQLTVGSIVWGSARSAQVGYWIDEAFAGRNLTPTAVAMAIDHCFFVVGLHRVEASIRPENQASRRVVEKLGFREEGLRRRYLHIDGAWRDHLCYALTVEDVPGGLLAALAQHAVRIALGDDREPAPRRRLSRPWPGGPGAGWFRCWRHCCARRGVTAPGVVSLRGGGGVSACGVALRCGLASFVRGMASRCAVRHHGSCQPICDTPGRMLVNASPGPYRASREHARDHGIRACGAAQSCLPRRDPGVGH